ncbi:MAG: ATP-binding protein [Bacteroidales bacterium]|nr:ATP-binding protein [Bacteroidales bacterium]
MSETKNIEQVSITIGSRMYATFKDVKNSPSHVLAEFVDNALQSSWDNAPRLKELDPNYKLEVDIDIEWNPEDDRPKKVVITDNAGGIPAHRYVKAFMPAKIPENNKGLHEKGMGMKTAACWLGYAWSVKTTALGETVERTMSFNLNDVVDKDLDYVPVKEVECPADAHYTIVTIDRPTENFPTIRKMDDIKTELSSIYRKSFRNKEMILKVCGEELTFEEYAVLEAPFVRTPDADPIYWKKNIEISYGEFKATGFIGLLSEMKSSQNGIVIIRRGRVILGAGVSENRYTPFCLCGSVGSPRYKRVFGEIEIEGFDVSFNKNDILDRASLDLLMELVAEEVHTREFDLITQGNDFRSTDTRKLVNSLLKKHSNASKGVTAPVAIPVREPISAASSPASNPNEIPSQPSVKKPVLLGQYEEAYTINNVAYIFRVQFVDRGDLVWVDLSQKENGIIICRINSEHDFFKTFKMSEPIIAILKTIAISKFVAHEEGDDTAKDLMNNFNDYIRYIKL